MRGVLVSAVAVLTLTSSVGAQPGPERRPEFASPLTLTTSDTRLRDAFMWARTQASAYAFDGDAVGPWFEAALPGREAFCMRDVAHQVLGAHALGMQRHVRNMLQRFASEIRAERDWASLWEIDRHGRPAKADYRTDHDFWYNLPANFDVLDAAYRMYLWSGDAGYIRDSAMLHFYDRSVTDYVDGWALGIDAIMTRPRLMNAAGAPDPDARFAAARGIPGYNEETDDFVVGLDLLAAQYAGYLAYARMQEARGAMSVARTWLAKAAAVKALVNERWWDERTQSFHDYLGTTHALGHRGASAWNSAALYWPVADEGPHVRATLESLVRQIRTSPSAPIEEQSHHPEVLYRYGDAATAYDQILDLTRPTRERREYPEVSFSVVGAVVSGLMGVSVDPVAPGHEAEVLPYFANPAIQTVSGLTAATAWAELAHLPVKANDVTIRHAGVTATAFTNNRGPALVWQAAFIGRHAEVIVDGRRMKAVPLMLAGGRVASAVRIVVAPGVTVRASVAP